jgi:hypothetical protein
MEKEENKIGNIHIRSTRSKHDALCFKIKNTAF